MPKTAKIDVKESLLTSVQAFLGSVLELDNISAILVPQHLPMKDVVMPTLVTDTAHLDNVDPLAPVFPLNAARVVSRLTRKPIGGKVAVVLRPCEIRAFIELVKLKQGNTDEIIIIGIDCPGTYPTRSAKITFSQTPEFYEKIFSGKETVIEGTDISPACKACEHPVPKGADMLIGLFGVDISKNMLIQAFTSKGEDLFDALKLSKTEEPKERQIAVEKLIAERIAYRDKMFAETAEATNTLEKLTTYFASCINCYNCRVACPVCYCKECVFVTDLFYHDPSQYLEWARRKGVIKMPTDTVFYHITRLAHISTACVGCGQCSNACPNDIPVMELFRTVAYRTQKAFDYEAGRSLDEKPPLSEFKEDEFEEIVGIG